MKRAWLCSENTSETFGGNDMKKLGIYAGSFDPFHVGHLDIVQQAMHVFDKVLVAKGVNPEKSDKIVSRYPLPEKLLHTIGATHGSEAEPKLITCNFNNLLTELVMAWEKSGWNVTLVRGLRNGADLEYEQNMVAFLRDMHPRIKLVAFYCDPKYRHVSSSALRGIEKISELEYRKYAIAV